ncbi:glycine-rich cell wall structural protein-like isoform X4 [Maniola jurtina]|uniref:glycine-rich cell wall structural protein-like isoform X4 n=1 Tax=Maniola jurtina TaxID=191418 RepID=UPI001E68CB50|nr:glycine-rich cell wall structural protein-like isoform X4 [Maniola jurtina]
MKTLLCIALFACVCMAYYATALPHPGEEIDINNAHLEAGAEGLVPAENRYKRGGGGGYGGRGGGHGYGRGGGYGGHGGRGGHGGWGR